MRALPLLLLLGCLPKSQIDGSGGDDTADTAAEDTAGDDTGDDTQDTEETGDTQETGETGETGDTGDTGPDDTGPDDTGEDTGRPSEGFPPVPGDLLITEFQYNTNEPVADAIGEWFEVQNLADVAIELDGVVISDTGTNAHTIVGPLVVGPGDWLVIGRSTDRSANGGAPVDYAIPGTEFEMSNSADEIILTLGRDVLDEVAYDEATFPNVTGYAVQLRAGNDVNSNDVGANWCQGTQSYGTGQYGTPGAANEGC